MEPIVANNAQSPQTEPLATPPLPPIFDGNSSDQSRSSKWLIIVGGVITIVFLLIIFFGAKYLAARRSTSSLSSGIQIAVDETPKKYALDSDSDEIPDLIENELTLNPSVSELSRCQPSQCGDTDVAQNQVAQNNILIILDSSGSMNLQIGGRTKMELAKEAINKFVQSSSDNVKIGLMVYGHKGSNSATDKPASCASAETIAPIGTINSSSIVSYLSQVNPVGWTPIGLAIRNGMSAFVGKEGQNNQMIVVTDGEETCNSNPIGEALVAKSSTAKVRVDVIGFGVTSAEQTSLQSISSSGGGLFSVAANADQLLSEMQNRHAVWGKYQTDAKCTAEVYLTSSNCLQEVSTKVNSYLTTQEASLKGSEWTEMSNLRNKIYSRYSTEINKVQDEWNQANIAQRQKLSQ